MLFVILPTPPLRNSIIMKEPQGNLMGNSSDPFVIRKKTWPPAVAGEWHVGWSS